MWPALTEAECVTPGDKKATHFGSFDGDVLIGCASFHHISDKEMRIRRVAVLPQYRGHGIGSFLLKTALERMQLPHLEEIWLNARIPAQNFYKRLGFHTVGERFFEREVEEIRMIKKAMSV
ncbi:MAG: GNAT family N-acetyltransferase [Zymomonas mobilis subsp. pomaceae]|uniref:GNAT family N-acetyltransferase n=1 Tax=Zymomonas mobilis TaxID=542 RepID=UPI0002EFED58|nr:GNAT family N-acetyltransferase [Zymomonas mobilis]MDX5948980.1 GNAT family N-acetyltransferase [Zymomonas mobilis subsp. pomaceae]GEB88785.1 hypothetical protein ZMO02_04220 [Zymomonas mobilis subsp. pomaceae]